MESFFHGLKSERVHHRIYGTRAEARRDLLQAGHSDWRGRECSWCGGKIGAKV